MTKKEKEGVLQLINSGVMNQADIDAVKAELNKDGEDLSICKWSLHHCKNG